ncbi:MAG: HetP family heterocyst commitment protein [Methylacidiphilales bacterium]|nr:HetP family heterocyst commitment protein [Candidatus Methylacidiphilales bacterium]NJR18148.1 HetP family heterocyst commitment protein [Calothrix sp. CSU_2_0]
MNQSKPSMSSNFDKAINPEQLDRVVEAILAGKYSWACVLMLRFAGYNPLHYIPYRTYNRLLKENSPSEKSHQQRSDHLSIAKSNNEKRSDGNLSPSCLSKIKDLAYLEVVGKQKREVRGGGNIDEWLSAQISENQQLKSDLQPEVTQKTCLRLCEFN